jgi:hypothetical protein
VISSLLLLLLLLLLGRQLDEHALQRGRLRERVRLHEVPAPALEGLKQLDAALVDYDRTLIFNPAHQEAKQHRENLLRALGRI